MIDQQVRQPVRGLVELAVGQERSAAHHGHRVGVHGPPAQRTTPSPTSWTPGRASTARLPHRSSRARSTSSSRSTDGQPPARIGGQRRQHSLATDRRADSTLSASKTSVRNSTVTSSPAGSPPSSHRSPSENARSMRAVSVSTGKGVTCRSPSARPGGVAGLPGEVLPAQQHLHQRVVGQAPGRVEPLDQHLERHVLMLVGGQAAPAYLGQQLDEGGVTAGQVDAQHQGVDEEADQVVERGVAAPGDRKANRHIRSGADLGQQRGERGLDHHEAGRVVFARDATDLVLQLHRPLHAHPRAAMVGHRRVGPIGGQLQLLGQSGQGVVPSSPAARRSGPPASSSSPKCLRCHSV